jgi:hypothetical protein
MSREFRDPVIQELNYMHELGVFAAFLFKSSMASVY